MSPSSLFCERDRFDVGGLGEKIYGDDASRAVSEVGEASEIATEGGRVTRDDNDTPGSQTGDSFGYTATKT